MTEHQPPTARYQFTLTVTGNTLDEVMDEILSQTNGGFLLDSDGYKRDSWHVIGGRSTRVMEHVDPDMTPERYDAELGAWFTDRKAQRKETAR
ncbi:MAG TPA: hypothetical protein VIO38_15610 [Rariglobus sp.]